jgi:signal peptidase I
VSARLGLAVRWARQALLTIGAVLGVLCALVTIGAVLFGLRPLVFQSGSMSPAIRTGDLALSRSVGAPALEKGQIVSVPTADGTRVSHRIVSVEHDHGQAVLVLRGDANAVSDATPYRVDRADVVLFHLPRLGYVVGWLSSPLGLFALGLYAAFLVSVLVRRSPQQGPGPGDAGGLTAEPRVVAPAARRSGGGLRLRRRHTVPGGLALVLVAGCAVGMTTAQRLTPTLAAFTDTVPVTGSTLTAATVAAPALKCQSRNLFTVTFEWTAVPGATSYSFYTDVGATPATVTGTTHTVTFFGARRYASVVANRAFPSTTWSSDQSNEVSYASFDFTC